jgi:hypothetical protein
LFGSLSDSNILPRVVFHRSLIYSETTVKASDFGPHGLFIGPFLASSVASLMDGMFTKNRTEQNSKFANLSSFYIRNFIHFSVGSAFMIASSSEKKKRSSKFT